MTALYEALSIETTAGKAVSGTWSVNVFHMYIGAGEVLYLTSLLATVTGYVSHIDAVVVLNTYLNRSGRIAAENHSCESLALPGSSCRVCIRRP